MELQFIHQLAKRPIYDKKLYENLIKGHVFSIIFN